MKRFFALFTVVLILLLMMIPAASAESTEPDYIYFQVPVAENVAWKHFRLVYAHIWEENDGDFYSWQGKDERCEDMGNGYWRYDLSELTFREDGTYYIIFSNENGMQTYDLHFTAACRGDYVYCNGDTCTNPVDSEVVCTVARWGNNSSVYPAARVGSDGLMINPDNADTETMETAWGTAEGVSVDLPEVEQPAEETSVSDNVLADGSNEQSALAVNPFFNPVTIAIIAVCSLVIIAVIVLVIIFARKNRTKKE